MACRYIFGTAVDVFADKRHKLKKLEGQKPRKMSSTKNRLSATFTSLFGCTNSNKKDFIDDEITDELKPLPAFLTIPNTDDSPRTNTNSTNSTQSPVSARNISPGTGSQRMSKSSFTEGTWKYTQGKKLGRGITSEVFIVDTLEGSPKVGRYALKRMVVRSEEEKKRLLKEAQILDKLKHPNIVEFVDVFAETKYGSLEILTRVEMGTILLIFWKNYAIWI